MLPRARQRHALFTLCRANVPAARTLLRLLLRMERLHDGVRLTALVAYIVTAQRGCMLRHLLEVLTRWLTWL